ncbi:MAG: glycosyltransferase family 2 protein [Candidatus Heimdallarchaeaceae archaeon]
MSDLRKKQRSSTKSWRILGVFFYIFTVTIFIISTIYLIWSLIKISQESSHSLILQTILNVFSLLVEVIGIFYTVMLFYHVSTTCFYPPVNTKTQLKELSEFPMISILIPVHYPDLKVLEKTLDSILKTDYPNEKLQVLVGGDAKEEESQIEQILELCSAFNAKYIHDESNKHFKAGMLNILLKETKGKYTVFLDYDHYITKDFLKKSIAVLEKDSDIAFVQAKVNFYNVKSKLQVWESVMYAQFFEVFERSKNNRSAVLFNGSTACFRRSVIDEIGGIPTATFTEDVDLSIQVLTKGYKSNLIEDYGSFGLVPATFSLLLSQILRWAKGSLHTLKKRWTQILFSKISFFNKLDLFFSTSLFFIASTMYLTIAIYIIMFFTKSVAIRLPISAFPPLILMPISFSVGYLISGVIAVLYAKKMGVKKMAVKDLFLFFLIALALNPFTVYAVIKSLFRVRAPTKDKDVWNEEISYLTFSFLFSLLGVGILVIAVFDFLGSTTLWVVLGLIGLSLLGTFPISLYFHFSTKNNKAYLLNENNNIVE